MARASGESIGSKVQGVDVVCGGRTAIEVTGLDDGVVRSGVDVGQDVVVAKNPNVVAGFHPRPDGTGGDVGVADGVADTCGPFLGLCLIRGGGAVSFFRWIVSARPSVVAVAVVQGRDLACDEPDDGDAVQVSGNA